MSDRERVFVVGAGPGGLTAAMILAHRGYEVEVFEKEPEVGGRSAAIRLGDYTFDTGPTFLMMLWILEEAFAKAGRKVSDYLDIRRVDPMYRLVYGDGRVFLPTADAASMEEQIERLFPGEYAGYQRFLAYERRKIDYVVPCLQVPYDKLHHMARWRLIKALPFLDAQRSLFAHLGRYFQADPLKLAFTFQAKYLGMSPWSCPATFSIISYIEHSGGIHHPIGGLCSISHAMAKVIEEEGGRLHRSTPVEEVLVRDGRAVGVRVGGEERLADHVVVNADVGHALTRLVRRDALRSWTPERLEKAGLSCSIFMLYFGVSRRYDLHHHNIFFATDYARNVREMSVDMKLSDDFSFYVQNACVTDPTLAPEGKSTIYVLVPVPNTRAGLDWAAERGPLRDRVVQALERRAGLTDFSRQIEEELVISPADWEQRYAVYRGAVFNLAHTVDQMLWFRPHNAYEDFARCYLVGGGTHPGSGLPTIYQSGMIAADLIQRAGA